jgi:hypothetical protein
VTVSFNRLLARRLIASLFPRVGVSMKMHDRKDMHFFILDGKEKAVRKPTKQRAPNVSMNDWELLR